jgi:hypothetical protein
MMGAAMTDDLDRRRRIKNWALLIVLAGMALLFYFVTMLRFGGQ